MHRIARATTAGSSEATGGSRGLFGRAFAIRGGARGSEGTGAPSLGRIILLAALAVLAVFATTAPTASAALAPGYGSIGSFNPEVGGNGPGHIAVDDATGNILLADPGNNRVLVFAPDLTPGGTATFLTELPVEGPDGVAIDQSTHALYVSSSTTAQVHRYLSNNAPVPTYTLDPTFTAPPLSYDPLGGLPLAVDPSTGDLLVGEHSKVSRYSSTGTLLSSFDGSGSSAGVFKEVHDVAASETKTYVVDYIASQGHSPVDEDGSTRIFQFGAGDAFEQTLETKTRPTLVAVDSSLQRLLTVGRVGQNENGSQIATYENAAITGVTNANPPGGTYSAGLAVDGGASHRAYFASNYGVTVFVPAPGTHADSSVSTSSTEAELTGLVNPEGKTTKAHFEYCSERDPCAKDNSVEWTSTPEVENLEGSADIPISAPITGLVPHTRYLVRIHAEDTLTSDYSNTATVMSGDAAPLAQTGPTSFLSDTEATLNGSVTALGVQSTYYFEYGTTTAYGDQTSPGVIGNGFSPRAVARTIAGLQPATTYHYRIVGVNSAGTTPGADLIFTTDTAGQPSRGYEMVSPVEKQGVGVSLAFAGTRVSPDGNRIVYGSAKASLPGAGSTPFVPRIFAARDASGWANTKLDLPWSNTAPSNTFYFDTIAVSNDVRRALILSDRKLTPDGVEGIPSLYIRGPGASPELTFVAADPRLGVLSSEQGAFSLAGTSDDLRTTAFTFGGETLVATQGQGVRLASVLPDGSPAKGFFAVTPAQVDRNSLSADGTKLYFQTVSAGVKSPLFLRKNPSEPQSQIVGGVCTEPERACTVPISVSHRPGALLTPLPAIPTGASPDGRYVEFQTVAGSEGLTQAAPDEAGFYNYDTVSNGLTYLGPAPNPSFEVPRPARDSIFYFVAAGGEEEGKLYYAKSGVVKTVASFGGGKPLDVRGSGDGRYYAFTTEAKITSYESNGHLEAYLYDSQSDALQCVSCRTDGGPASGRAGLGLGDGDESVFNGYRPRAVLDDGTVFFDTTDPLVSTDVNGTRDVYSYRDGHVTLISPGKLPFDYQFEDATPDGSDVFFSTYDKLVAQDRDTTADLYDARIGGGIAAQNTPPAPVCSGEECRTTVAPPPVLPTVGSKAINGPGNPPRKKPAKHKKKHHAKKHKKAGKKRAKTTDRRQAR